MRKTILGLVLLALVLGGGGFAWFWFSGGSGEPTTDVTAPPLASETSAPTTTPADTASTTPADTAPTTTAEANPSTTADANTSTPPSDGPRTFVISEEATARFEIDEVLRGEPKTVVGTTGEVAGQFRFDPSDLSTAEISEILVNARTFETDASSRDRAIRGPIVLDSASDEFELITFTPTSIEGLPDSIDMGETVAFTIVGDVEIKGTTNEEVFEVELTWSSPDRIEGTATTTVDRTEYGIDIPDVAFVADVSEEVLLAFDIVAEGT